MTVHPLERKAAALDDISTGLEAKFSIPYLTAFTLLRGAPSVDSFRSLDPDARALAAERVRVRTSDSLRESEAVMEVDGREVTRVEAALGSPERPMSDAALRAKIRDLAGDHLDGLLDDPNRQAREILQRLDAG